jgi:hypothetical protein
VAREQRLGELEAVVQQQRDAVAAPHAGVRQHRGKALGPIMESSVGALVLAEDEGRAIGVSAPAPTYHLRQDQPP